MPRAASLALLIALVVGACIPARVKELNSAGRQAIAERRYDLAVRHLSESLAIYPDQPKVALQLDSAKVMLKQIYVTRIYDLVDGPVQPLETFVEVWKMSAELPQLDVDKARVASIRIDLDKHFARAEETLRARTEPHAYYLKLGQMSSLVPSPAVSGARSAVAESLERMHLRSQRAADAGELAGLALLHTAAAATFAPGDTGLWAETTRRRLELIGALGIPVRLEARSQAGAAAAMGLLGGLKRRLPRIFQVQARARLQLVLEAGRPASEQNAVKSRHSARCQVGTAKEKNPECESLARRADSARRTVDAKLAALETARVRCASQEQASACRSYLSSASRDLDSARRDQDALEQQVSRCPPFVEQPVYKTFFYERTTITRRAGLAGQVRLLQDGEVWQSRGVSGTASAADTYGDGLACADIPADPLALPSPGQLQVQAEEEMLNKSLGELYQMRRELAQKQLAGGRSPDERLDALVRARLVDESYRQATELLSRNMIGMWSSDFDLPRRLVQ